MCWICTLLFSYVQTPWDSECDVWWDEVMKDSPEECEPEWMDAEDPLFILYTSGSTGKPKVGHSGLWETSFVEANTQFGLEQLHYINFPLVNYL